MLTKHLLSLLKYIELMNFLFLQDIMLTIV